MNLRRTRLEVAVFVVTIVLVASFMTPAAIAQEPTPGYNNKIPESILTPDKLKTRYLKTWT